MKFDVSILEKVRDLIKESNSIGRIYTINKNNIEALTENNEELKLAWDFPIVLNKSSQRNPLIIQLEAKPRIMGFGSF